MRRPRAPLFLARAKYRRRRIRDAARVLPVVGALFLLMPILWGPGGGGDVAAGSEARDTGGDLVYLFLVWAGLVGAAMVFSGSLAQVNAADDPEDED